MTCVWCNKAEATQIHHIIPRYIGGTDDLDNTQEICAACHRQHHSENGDFVRWGTIGGYATLWKYGRQHMKRIAIRGGKKGGATLKRTRGSAYFSEIGRKGAIARNKKLVREKIEWLF